MKFRPLLWPTLVALPTFLILLWLGTWQLQRLEWKNDLFAAFAARSSAAPMTLPAASDITPELEFRRLNLVGSFDHSNEVFLTGRTYEGNAGFHVVTPFQLSNGRTILINRGWVSEDYRDPAKRTFSLVEGATNVEAILRFPGSKGYFVPENEPNAGFWFTLIPAEIITHLGLDGAETTIYADAVRTSDVLTLPIAAKTRLNLRNSHLGYAFTWYGIALGLLGVYLAFHHQAGRFSIGRTKKD